MRRFARKTRAPFIAGLFAAGTILTGVSLQAQLQIGRDEIRITSRSYVPKQHVLRVQSNAVEISAVVRDTQGRAVPGLSASDFEVADQEKPQTISSFVENRAEHATDWSSSSSTKSSTSPPQPAAVRPLRFIALFFDDLNTPPGDFRRAQLAAERFVNESLLPGDRAAILANSDTAEVLFSDDRPKLLDAIEKLHGHPRVPERGLQDCPKISPYEAYLISNELDPQSLDIVAEDAAECGGGTREDLKEMVRAEASETWDLTEQVSQNTLARLQGVIATLAKVPGQRTLLVVSSGFLTPTLQHSQDIIVNQALRAGVVIDALDARGLVTEALGPQPGDVGEYRNEVSSNTRLMYETRMMTERQFATTAAMADLADSTGGTFFHNNNDLNLGFRRAAAAPEFSYLLGFSPDSGHLDGKYHKLKVRLTNRKDCRVQARPGYFAPVKASTEPTAEEKLDAEMRGTDEKTGLPVIISDTLNATSAGARQLSIQAHVDIQKLPFERQKDRHVEKLTFMAALFDQKGNFITGKQADMELALKPASFERFSKSGISGTMSFQVPPGTYRLRVVVQEAVHGNLAAVTKEVQIQWI